MWDTSRGLREQVVHGLAMVGLLWALAVLGTLFVVSAARGDQPGSYPVDAAPRSIGLALALAVLVTGLGVLAVGAVPLRRDHDLPVLTGLPAYDDDLADELATELPADLPLALGLSLTA